jgi:hypothetical protein
MSIPTTIGTSRPLLDIPLQLRLRTPLSLTRTMHSTLPLPSHVHINLRLRTPLSLTRTMHSTLPLPSHMHINHRTTPRLIARAARGSESLREHTQPLGAGPGSIGHPSPDATGDDENDTPHTPPPSSPSRLPSTLPPTTRCSSRGKKSPHLCVQAQHVSMPRCTAALTLADSPGRNSIVYRPPYNPSDLGVWLGPCARPSITPRNLSMGFPTKSAADGWQANNSDSVSSIPHHRIYTTRNRER